MKRTPAFVLLLLITAALAPASSFRESADNPITVESQIREITDNGDTLVLSLQRQPYAFVVSKAATRVRLKNGARIEAAELRVQDYVRVHGDLDRNTVYVRSLIVLGRTEHRP